MPVIVLYRDRTVTVDACRDVIQVLASTTTELLKAAIEVRVVQVADSYNANAIHIEMRFRDFREWTDDQIATYHQSVMERLAPILKRHRYRGKYSFYIIPSTPPRSVWAQGEPDQE